jgi:hypothetical protein
MEEEGVERLNLYRRGSGSFRQRDVQQELVPAHYSADRVGEELLPRVLAPPIRPLREVL